MKTVLLMRHAEAAEAERGQSDIDRPLTAAGVAMAWQTGLLLQQLGVMPQRIVASSALRTTQTAVLVRESVVGHSPPDFSAADPVVDIQRRFGSGIPVQLQRGLYGAAADVFADAARYEASPDEDRILVVGHNPGMAMLMCCWSCSAFSVPPATLAVFQFSVDDWLEAGRSGCRGELRLLIRNGQIDRSHGTLTAGE